MLALKSDLDSSLKLKSGRTKASENKQLGPRGTHTDETFVSKMCLKLLIVLDAVGTCGNPLASFGSLGPLGPLERSGSAVGVAANILTALSVAQAEAWTQENEACIGNHDAFSQGKQKLVVAFRYMNTLVCTLTNPAQCHSFRHISDETSNHADMIPQSSVRSLESLPTYRY